MIVGPIRGPSATSSHKARRRRGLSRLSGLQSCVLQDCLDSGLDANCELDIRGEVYPYAFLREHALEQMDAGQMLHMILGNRPRLATCPVALLIPSTPSFAWSRLFLELRTMKVREEGLASRPRSETSRHPGEREHLEQQRLNRRWRRRSGQTRRRPPVTARAAAMTATPSAHGDREEGTRRALSAPGGRTEDTIGASRAWAEAQPADQVGGAEVVRVAGAQDEEVLRAEPSYQAPLASRALRAMSSSATSRARTSDSAI